MSNGKSGPADGTPLRVLIVEAQPLYALGIARALEEVSWVQVAGTARTVQAAVLAATDLKPNVILLDSSLPDFSVPESAIALREMTPDAWLVMLMPGAGQGASARAWGADLILPKCIGGPELIEGLNKLRERPVSPGGSRLRRLRLTLREVEVLKLTVQGLTSSEAGRVLSLTARSVEAHRSRIMRKLGVQNRVELVRYAASAGLCAGTASDQHA